MEKRYSLREAGRFVGVDRRTLKGWLVADLAMVFPELPKGAKLMIRESDLLTVVRRRQPQSDFGARRRLLQVLHTRAKETAV